jgi:hypothetical protein
MIGMWGKKERRVVYPIRSQCCKSCEKGKKQYLGMISIVASEWDADDSSRVAHFGVRLLQCLVTSQRSVSTHRKRPRISLACLS